MGPTEEITKRIEEFNGDHRGICAFGVGGHDCQSVCPQIIDYLARGECRGCAYRERQLAKLKEN